MKSKTSSVVVRVLSLLLVASSTLMSAQENQERRSTHLTGLINDYTPSTVQGGPYEMHGQWSMEVNQERGTADFTADMTMSDYAMTPAGTPDATQGGQNAHTHHIRLTNIPITWDMVGCPAYSPATTHGFQVKGTVNLITGNGSNAKFEPIPPASILQVCVTGGTEVAYSNLAMVFVGPATQHFGVQAIHGVVRKSEESR